MDDVFFYTLYHVFFFKILSKRILLRWKSFFLCLKCRPESPKINLNSILSTKLKLSEVAHFIVWLRTTFNLFRNVCSTELICITRALLEPCRDKSIDIKLFFWEFGAKNIHLFLRKNVIKCLKSPLLLYALTNYDRNGRALKTRQCQRFK